METFLIGLVVGAGAFAAVWFVFLRGDVVGDFVTPTGIVIDDVNFTAKSVNIVGDKVFVDGKEVQGQSQMGRIVEVRVSDGILGHLTTDVNVNCGDVAGSVNAGGSVNCDAVGGDVKAGANVNCDDVMGAITAGGNVVGRSA